MAFTVSRLRAGGYFDAIASCGPPFGLADPITPEVRLRPVYSMLLAPLSLAIAFAACASPGTASRRSSPDSLTAEEIRTSTAGNAYDLIRQLRPNWLRATGTGSISGGVARTQAVLVYLDGQRFGELRSLETLGVNGIRSMQWLDPGRAATVLTGIGSDPIAGAISIRTH